MIKWNPRKSETATLAALLESNEATRWQNPHPGERITVWDKQVAIDGRGQNVRRVMRLTERTIDAKGQQGLHCPDAPVRHAAKRRRIKTVIQELIYRAARLIDHGHQRMLGLGANDRSAQVFGRPHGAPLAGCG